tara:strand:+ start:492 stop:1211 length:720 start_codon:yes stop_codon:yes gene_type:complete
MIDESAKLKLRIENFQSNFLTKDKIIIFEENKFDLLIGILFNVIKIILLPTINFFSKPFMKIIDKLLDIVTQQRELKKKILKQEETLFKNTKLNSVLSEQISELNRKIDQLSVNSVTKLDTDSNEEITNPINNNEISELSNTEVSFYQKENLRISNELYETQKKFEIMKNEIEKFQNQRSNLIEKINSVNDVIQDSNIVTNVFENNEIKKRINVKDPEISNKASKIDLDLEIEKIFSKK